MKGKLGHYRNAVVSETDPSVEVLNQVNVTNWLDYAQLGQHRNYAGTTPQHCYANGQPPPPPAAYSPGQNEVPWTRVADWESIPSPDDSYIGGAISWSDIQNMQPGSQCSSGCLLQFNFQLPSTPDVPCASGCNIGDVPSPDLRYMSLTFWVQTNPGNTIDNFDPDGLLACSANCSQTYVSLADTAFATTPAACNSGTCEASLIVNTGGGFPPFLAQPQPPNLPPCTTPHQAGCGVTEGVQPVTYTVGTGANAVTYFTVWTTSGGYTVLDLTQFPNFETYSGPNSTSQLPLLLTLRNTLPSSGFACSGSAVPFNTAEYTAEGGASGGLMGPYAPQVALVPLSALGGSPTFNLPSSSACGLIPNAVPGSNTPGIPTQGGVLVDFPNIYWPNSQAAPPNLVCSSSAGPESLSTEIYFVGTQIASRLTTRQALLSIMPVLFLSYNDHPTTFYLNVAGLIAFIVALLVTTIVEVPIVKQIATWTISSLPDNWQKLRDRWGAFHIIRVVAGILGVTLLVAGAIF